MNKNNRQVIQSYDIVGIIAVTRIKVIVKLCEIDNVFLIEEYLVVEFLTCNANFLNLFFNPFR